MKDEIKAFAPVHRARWPYRLWAHVVAISPALVAGSNYALAEEALFISQRLTPTGEYTKGIEGPAVDAKGTLYVVNFKETGTIGKLKPGTKKSELFAKLPAGSIGNAIRFDRDGRMYVADHKKHNVFVFEHGQTVPRVYFHSEKLNQPNDLAIATDGTLYASDPNFRKKSGQIWRITRGSDGNGRGVIMVSERTMGVTNGIDLSPDGEALYVSESNTREIWAYRIGGTKLSQPRLVKRFDTPNTSELDGLQTDIDGTLFVTRPGSGTVAMVMPNGTLVREIRVTGKTPSNLTFGGPDGKTVYVTQVEGGYIESFRVDRPGRETCLRIAGATC